LNFDELVRLWAEAKRPREKSRYVIQLAVDTFKSLIGDIPVERIGHEEIFDFRDMLAIFPAVRTPRERKMSAKSLYRARLRKQDGRPTLTPTTIRKKVNAIQALVGFAYNERWISQDDTHGIPLTRKPIILRRSFRREELRQLFADRLFVRRWSPSTRKCRSKSDVALRWIFFLALMTGARIEEICQLYVHDIIAHDGIWALRIDDRGSSGEQTEKHLKTRSSRRLVPLHPRLIDLGFIPFVAERRASNERWLFSELKADPWHRRAQAIGKRCASLIDRVSKDPALVFHSFRHTFKDLCREAGIQDSVNDQLTGHAPTTIGGAYGTGVSMAALASAIHALDFEFVAWEPILRAVQSREGRVSAETG